MWDQLHPIVSKGAPPQGGAPRPMPPQAGGPPPQAAMPPPGAPPMPQGGPMPPQGAPPQGAPPQAGPPPAGGPPQQQGAPGTDPAVAKTLMQRATSITPQEGQAFFNGITVPALLVLKKILPEMGPAIDNAIAQKQGGGAPGGAPAPGAPPPQGGPPMPPQGGAAPPPRPGMLRSV